MCRRVAVARTLNRPSHGTCHDSEVYGDSRPRTTQPAPIVLLLPRRGDSDGLDDATLRYPAARASVEDLLQFTSQRSKPVDLVVDGREMALHNCVNLSARIFRLVLHGEQGADRADL